MEQNSIPETHSQIATKALGATDAKNSAIAASENVDNFAAAHSPLTTYFHNNLKMREFFNIFALPYSSTTISNFYTTKRACVNARNACIEKAYYAAQNYISPYQKKNVAHEVAAFYSKNLNATFISVIDQFETLFLLRNQASAYTQLKELVQNSQRNLERQYNEELNDSTGYYTLYTLDYFIDQTDIETHDRRFTEGIYKILERLVPDSIEYSMTNVYSSIEELENDVNARAQTFYGVAHQIYADYVEQIELLLENASKTLPDFLENENIINYLDRVIKSAS